MTDAARINQFKSYTYYDPKSVLIGLRNFERDPQFQRLPDELKALRTNKLKRAREGRQAAIFCYGLQASVLKRPVFFTNVESEDFDAVALWTEGDAQAFTPIQLKEWVPARNRPRACFFELLEKAKSYPNVTLAIYLNRQERLAGLNFDKVQSDIEGIDVWLFGSGSPDCENWFLLRKAVHGWERYDFQYPTE